MSYDLIDKAIEPGKLSTKARKLVNDALEAGRFLLQPKYDGVNGVLDVSPTGGSTIRSRTGETLLSCAHIVDAANAAMLPAGRYFGEVYAFNTPHHKISGLARQHDPAPALVFMCFDYITSVELAAGGTDVPYSRREDRLACLMIRRKMAGPIFLADGFPAPATATIELLLERTPAMLAALRQRGGAYDGLMLKLTDAPFTLGGSGSDGRSLKLKPRATADLLVVGTYPGEGKYEGMMGGIIVSLDGTPTGPTCKVGTGFDDAQRAPGIVWTGKIVEVTYLDMTKAKKLREPAFLGERHDKLQADNLLEN